MAISLLLGNGINLLSEHSITWSAMLQDIAANSLPGKKVEHLDKKPYALVFEEIVLAEMAKKSKRPEFELKQQVATLTGSFGHNDFHQRIMRAGVRHILTTNYDYSLEKAINPLHLPADTDYETTYSVFRRRKVGKTSVWHIHGEAEEPRTVMLGYHQYSGYLQKLRSYATGGLGKDKLSPFKIGDLKFDSVGRKQIYSWLDIFLRDDIHIVGLGLDFTEIDLWWALTYKARLRALGHRTGKTIYHDWHSQPLSEQDKAKHSMLEALSVQVRIRDCSNGFKPAYNNFIKTVL